MAAIVVVGAQWGDEGKGKIVDCLAEQADMVVRYGGGANAGHTLRVGQEKLILHLLPSGVLRPEVECVLGPGMVIDPALLVEEIDELGARGCELTGRLTVSSRAHVTLPWLVAMDRAHNEGPRSLGTTGRGIGPTYEAKAARTGVHLGSLADMEQARAAIGVAVEQWLARHRVASSAEPSPEHVLGWLAPLMARLRPFLGDASVTVSTAMRAGQRVLFEGAQGALLDLDHGTYPYVTSSTTTAAGACSGVGVGPTSIDAVIGVAKAYVTRVGEGPFPTELHNEQGDELRLAGEEYGATTGRARRCGWLDLPALRYAARLNGLSAFAVTKLDVLTGRARIPVCVAYETDAGATCELPIDQLARARPLYRELDGWQEPLQDCRSRAALPPAAERYLAYIEEHTGVPVRFASVGASREQTILDIEPFALGAPRSPHAR